MILILQIVCCFLGLWFTAALLIRTFYGQTIPSLEIVLWALAITGVIFLWGK